MEKRVPKFGPHDVWSQSIKIQGKRIIPVCCEDPGKEEHAYASWTLDGAGTLLL